MPTTSSSWLRPLPKLAVVTPVVLISVAVSVLTYNWWTGALWLIGHTLIYGSLQWLDQPLTRPPRSTWLWVLYSSIPFTILLLAIDGVIHPRNDWRGFLHLDDVPAIGWLCLLSLVPLLIGLWLSALRAVQCLQAALPVRRTRLLWLLLAAGVGVGICLLFQHSENGFILFISQALLLLSIDIYLETNRTSLTWLLVWLLLFGLISATFIFRESQRIDLVQHQLIASDIAATGQPDSTRRYHLPFQWDTLSYTTAQERLETESLALSPGEGHQVRSGGRADWIWHRANNAGFIMVGRLTGGVRLPLAITSLFFIVVLLYVLLLRGVSWLLQLPYERWSLPLFGPSSLRIRIQLAFFGLLLIAFLLVAWFTINFFSDQPQFYNKWLEQLLSLYVFLLVIAGTIGILLANSITEPIVQIGQRLGGTRLQNNEPLSWPREDEIGRLVSNYNQMIQALEASAQQLAQQEREGAWREMAKQVAHEIKNPLTPMKLQLQQLLRLEKQDPERAREWSKLVAKRMIDQIDGLALIATEFSHFARLPEAKAITFELEDLLRSASDLHRSYSGGTTLDFISSTYSSTIFADRDQLLRVANNLIKNALQATEGIELAEVVVELSSDQEYVQFQIQDNGTGISPEVQGKIFQPNFTTKSSGMGLGLAMCKNIIEQAQGTIEFVTEQGVGTTFVVRLPRVMQEQTLSSEGV